MIQRISVWLKSRLVLDSILQFFTQLTKRFLLFSSVHILVHYFFKLQKQLLLCVIQIFQFFFQQKNLLGSLGQCHYVAFFTIFPFFSLLPKTFLFNFGLQLWKLIENSIDAVLKILVEVVIKNVNSTGFQSKQNTVCKEFK